MKTINAFKLIIACLGLFTTVAFGQDQSAVYTKMNKDMMSKHAPMKTYLIEREIPEAGKLTPEQLQGISEKSNTVLAEMGPEIEWLHSYVTDNKVYCVYRAANESLIREHAKKGGFPVNAISELATKINPDTGRKE